MRWELAEAVRDRVREWIPASYGLYMDWAVAPSIHVIRPGSTAARMECCICFWNNRVGFWNNRVGYYGADRLDFDYTDPELLFKLEQLVRRYCR